MNDGLREAIEGASAASAWPTSPECRNVEIAVRDWLATPPSDARSSSRDALRLALKNLVESCDPGPEKAGRHIPTAPNSLVYQAARSALREAAIRDWEPYDE